MTDIFWIAIDKLTPNGRNARSHSRKPPTRVRERAGLPVSRLHAAESVSRADSANCPLPRPIRSPKSVPDTVSRSREFQVPIQPRARVETVQGRPESWGTDGFDVSDRNSALYDNSEAPQIVAGALFRPSRIL